MAVAGLGLVGAQTATAETPAGSQPEVSASKILVEGQYLVDRVDTSIDPDGYTPQSLIEARGAAPSCMKAYTDGNLVNQWVDVRNDCGSHQRAKVLIAGGSDSQCHQFAPGQSIRHGYPRWGRFDGLVAC